jgi:uncharacterized protein
MLLRPDFNLKNIYEIDLQLLQEQGIKAIFFDLDSTIMVSKSGEYFERTQKWLEEVSKNFYIAVISNNKAAEYLEKVQNVSNFKIVGSANKPSTKAMRKLLEEINLQPHETVIVGDRPLTDIFAGKRLGAKTILVGSINAENEGKPTQFVRWLERRFILE